MLKPSLVRLFETYEDYHRHPVNRLTHKIAIPLIVFHIVAMLDWVVLVPQGVLGKPITLAGVAYLLVVAWYLSLDVRLGLWMGLLYGVCFPIGWVTPRSLVFVVALLGWGIQLAGHVVWEKRSPAFLTNLLQALVGPLFFVAVAMGRWPPEPNAGSDV